MSISTNMFQIDWNNQPEFQEIATSLAKLGQFEKLYVYKAAIPTCYKDVLQPKK